MSDKKPYLTIPPELVDGQHSSFVGPGKENGLPVLADLIAAWWEYAEVGDTITLKAVEMTDAEVEAIPEI